MAIQYYTGSKQVQEHFTIEIADSNISYMQFFSVFLSTCSYLTTHSTEIPPLLFRRQFLSQTSIIAMNGRQEFSRHDGSNVHCQLLQYHMLSYIHKNASMINWSLIKIPRKDFFSELHRQKMECFENLLQKLDLLSSTLELSYLRNTIVGRENET